LVPVDGLLTVNEGALAEQFAGQELPGSGLPFEDTPLFYWHREARNANAEVDYVIGSGAEIFPVEVKSAAGGALRSVFQFLKEKGRERATRPGACACCRCRSTWRGRCAAWRPSGCEAARTSRAKRPTSTSAGGLPGDAVCLSTVLPQLSRT